ncbi:MAG: NUDIX domain-containing protein [Vulcanimicrobiaceae bacterium]|jgi:ADP-ribose pyrophosphatase YjhB (NUDIX family)
MEGAVTQHRVRTLAVVRDERGFVLAVRHARRGERFWTLPGGFSNIGESLEETLVREVGEETGYRVRVDYLVTVFEIGSSRWEPRRLELCFACEVTEVDATLRRGSDGIVEVGWLDPNITYDDFLPSKLLPLLRNNTRGLYLGNITDTGHPLKK